MSELTAQRCEPCEGGVRPMGREEADRMMGQLHEDWSLTEDGLEIHRDFFFKGFNKTIGFVNAVAWIANAENHHPDFAAGYNYCEVTFMTHAIDGLSDNDFICAAKLNALFD